MKLMRRIKTLSIFLLCPFLLFGQKKFEGKIIYEISSSSQNQENSTIEAQKVFLFYKKNQVRFETEDHTTAIVYDYELGDQLVVIDMPNLGYRQAVISNIPKTEGFKLEKPKGQQTIMGQKCQKVSISANIDKQEQKISGYADFSYKVITGLDLSGNAIFAPLLYEFEMALPDGSTVRQKIVGIQEDSFNDKLFMIGYPEGFTFVDERKNMHNEPPKAYLVDDMDPFIKLATAELDEMVKTALETEDFETATLLKNVIEKRKREKLYSAKTIEELQEMIATALANEDFESAEEIQLEITNRLK